jgi:hypothetical protein
MGTNYYRIPLAEEVEKKRKILVVQIETMDLNPSDIEGGFRFISPRKDWEWFNPWDMFMEDMSVHLGKRSMGWKFCWNFHDKKYYDDKQTLIDYVLSGRVVDEYGEEINSQEFLNMAFDWGEPDGWVHDEKYEEFQRSEGGHIWGPKYHDKIIDGLRVSSSTDFS